MTILSHISPTTTTTTMNTHHDHPPRPPPPPRPPHPVQPSVLISPPFRHDYENFMIGLLQPESMRGAYFAIRAFNVEICTIHDQVPQNSPQAGRLRFQFWRDALNQIYSDKLTTRHPVADALSFYINKHDLTLRWFERSLEARYAIIRTNHLKR